MTKAQRTTLVMLPGLDGTGLVFDPFLKQLPETVLPQVVRYPTDKILSFQDYVDFVRAQLPKDKPFVLLAESFSGPIGLQLLADPPSNLAGLVLVATFSHYPSPFLLDAGSCLPQSLLLKLFSTTLCSRFFCLSGATGAAVKVFQKALASVQLKVLTSRLKILAELPPPETSFNGPCLYLQADSDRLVPSRALQPLQRLLPQLKVERISGPHIILLAKPEAGALRVSSFIAEATKQQ